MLALALVAAATGSAITYAALHGQDTPHQLGMSVLNGVGIAVGGCLGSALVLRFKAARRFINGVVHACTITITAIISANHSDRRTTGFHFTTLYVEETMIFSPFYSPWPLLFQAIRLHCRSKAMQMPGKSRWIPASRCWSW